MKNLIVTLIFGSILSFNVRAEYNGTISRSGSCGDNEGDCNYILYTDGHLEIEGTGAITTKVFWNNLSQDIKSVSIGAGITEIGSIAFRGTSNLETVTIASGSQLKTIGGYAFDQSGVKSINLPEGLETIGEGVFRYTQNLESIRIPDSVTSSIGYATFWGAVGLKDIYIGKNVAGIDSIAFRAASNLETVTFAENSMLQYIDSVAFDQTGNLVKVVLPKNISKIYANAFRYSCAEIVMPETSSPIEIVGGDTIGGCDGRKVKCPASQMDQCQALFYRANITPYTPTRRIYTVEEAARVSKPTGNRIMIRYK